MELITSLLLYFLHNIMFYLHTNSVTDLYYYTVKVRFVYEVILLRSRDSFFGFYQKNLFLVSGFFDILLFPLVIHIYVGH